jgi:signal transduction histidine kinase
MRDYIGMAEATITNSDYMSEEEAKGITDTLTHNATLLTRLVNMLYDSSDTAVADGKKLSREDKVYCNKVAREAIGYVELYYPQIIFDFRTEAGDDAFVYTSHLYLMRSLRELLYNAAKYSDGPRVVVSVKLTEKTLRYVIEDTGKGIAEADRELMFEPFTKVDDLSEGLGLGLPLAKRHFRNMGGDLTLDADYHAGCRFVAELPR